MIALLFFLASVCAATPKVPSFGAALERWAAHGNAVDKHPSFFEEQIDAQELRMNNDLTDLFLAALREWPRDQAIKMILHGRPAQITMIKVPSVARMTMGHLLMDVFEEFAKIASPEQILEFLGTKSEVFVTYNMTEMMANWAGNRVQDIHLLRQLARVSALVPRAEDKSYTYSMGYRASRLIRELKDERLRENALLNLEEIYPEAVFRFRAGVMYGVHGMAESFGWRKRILEGPLDAESRAEALRSLGSSKDGTSVAFAIPYINAPEQVIAGAAAEVLVNDLKASAREGELARPESILAVRDAAEQGSSAVRRALVALIQPAQMPWIEFLLYRALDDEDFITRYRAITNAGPHVRSERFLTKLRTMSVADPDALVREAAEEVLNKKCESEI